MTAVIGATHVLCSIGNGTEQVWATTRAGIARLGSSQVLDRDLEPIPMGLVPEDALGTLVAEIDALPLPSRARRMLRLAAPPFQEVAKDIDQPVPVLVGLPELTYDEAPWLTHFPAYLQRLTGVAVDRERSVVIPRGHAAALMALERAVDLLHAGTAPAVIVGGVDSYFDLHLLGILENEQRILGPRVMDGFIPGEGAAFYVLSAAGAPPRNDNGTRVVVDGAASVMDPGHRYGEAPARGEGLATALDQVRQRLSQPVGPIGTTFAGFNGESFDAKLWGVARLRHNDLFSPGMLIEHPADKFGDTGAAVGAILISLAAHSLATRTRSAPALVWAASDREPRACAVLSLMS